MSTIGKTLGNFEIASMIGKGGIREVCQAKDQKLGRGVVIKVLPEEFARDTDRAAKRFCCPCECERENEPPSKRSL